MTTISKRGYRWAILIGAGLVLCPIHNQRLTELVTSNGEVGFFLPAFGYAVWLIATLLFIVWGWETVKQNRLGDKRVLVPLLIIVGAIGLSGITANDWGDKFAPLLMGVALVGLYLVARVLGKDMFLPLAVGAGIASLGVIVVALHNPGQVTGGVVFEGNYDIVVGYVLLGAALFIHRYQWVLAVLALVAMFLSGSPEAVFVVGVLSIVVIWRRDWGRKLVVVLSPVALLVVLCFLLGYGQALYSYTAQILTGPVIRNEPTMPNTTAIGYRWNMIAEAMSSIKPLGDGYAVTQFRKGIVHNVPLVIVQQLGYLGVIAGLAWLWVSVWCLVKTRWKYVWTLILALSMFDHFVWTQLAPWWWAIVGVSTASGIKSDYIFKGA